MSQFTVRQLNGDDWQLYRNVRLESLNKHPAFFSPSRDETLFTENDWKERLTSANSATFGLFEDSKIIGITGIFKDGNDPKASKAYLVSSYIKENHRKQGLSSLFYEARINWAKEQKSISSLIVEHRDDNIPSQRVHQKFGFRFVESNDEEWPDGQIRPCLKYQLDLK